MQVQQIAHGRHRDEKSCRAGATLWLVTALWVAGAILGLFTLTVHALTPGAADVRPLWPAASRLERAPEGLSLFLFAHPKCPCLAAVLEELQAVRAASPAPLNVTIVFCRPAEAPAGWEQTASWRAAEALPGVRVACDPAGAEARRLGAQTSGHTVLYSGAGRLLFSGGITGARGHAGENAGRIALLTAASATAETTYHVTAPVYGCPLFTGCTSENNSCPR